MRSCASLVLLLLVALFAAPGCFKSSTSQASSESSSDSSASSSRSSSSPFTSSSASSRDDQYEQDVRAYTREHVLSGGDLTAFRLGLSDLAKKHGITDWEQDEATYVGIGRGLKKAGVSGERYQQLKLQYQGSNPESAKWIQSGYESEKKD